MKKELAILVLVIAGSALLAQNLPTAQPNAKRPVFDAFEVATIKPTPPDWTGGRFIRMQSAHQLIARNHALKTLIAAAFDINPNVISGGPAWVDSDKYDIVGEAPGDVRPNLDEQMAMLRSLLADRFKLTYHKEQKDQSFYALTVAKNGPKLMESKLTPDATPEGPPALAFVVALPAMRLPARYATMGEFASLLQRSALDRPVVDKTGLSGRFDFDLEFTPDETLFNGLFAGVAIPDDAAKPGLFTAIQQQLGLKLEAAKGPLEAIVIDHAERPSEN